jgi:hypothetical protein
MITVKVKVALVVLHSTVHCSHINTNEREGERERERERESSQFMCL